MERINLRQNLPLFYCLIMMAALATKAEGQSDEYNLPEDPKTPVIVFDRTGGFRMRPTVEIEPVLQIFGDGRVVAGRTSDQTGHAEIKIDRDRIQSLLKQCIAEQKFMEITSEGIREAIEESGQRVMIADAPSTEITINLKDKQNKVSVYALGYIANNMQGIEAVQRVQQVAQVLQLAHAEAVIGGMEKLEETLAFANQELHKKFPNAPELSLANATFAHLDANGKKSLNFSYSKSGDEGQLLSSYGVNLTIEKDGTTQAGIYGKER